MFVWPETSEKVELEIAQLVRLLDEHRELLERVADHEPTAVELSALSAYLHSFYTGIEGIFRQIAVDIDGCRSSAGRWHSELLDLMAHPTVERPALLSDELLQKLVGYLGFRHVFRHAYTFNLKWPKMKDLILESEQTLREVVQSCRSFFCDPEA